MKGTPRKGETPAKTGRSISKSPHSTSKPGLSQSKDSLNQDTYFCHYKNAMYMGSTKIFQRDGRGIMLHDDGTSALTSYEKDMLHGYNLLITTNGSLVSAHYNKNKLVDVAYKREGALFYGRFHHQLLDGAATVVNYEQKAIVYINAKRGVIIEKKQEDNQSILNKVFEIGSLETIIPEEHIRNLSFEMARTKDFEVIRRSSKITVGFTKSGFLNGLAFIVSQQSINPNCVHDTAYHMIERGYYKNSQLNGLGERRFRNGNVYVGQFKNNEFEGTGILKNSLKKNWVSGQFQRGKLVQLGKYSNDGTEKTSLKILEGIHQRKTSWVSKEISLTNVLFLDHEIKKIQEFKNNEKMMNLEARRQEMLRRIQDNFLTDVEDEAQQAPLKTTVLMESPLQRYLKTQMPSTYNRHEANSPAQDSMRSDSGSKLQSSRRKIFEEQNVSFREEIPKHDSYQIQVHPVPVEESFASKGGFKERDSSYMRDLQLKEVEASHHKEETPPAHHQSSSQAAIRDSLTLVGPKVHTFTAQRQTFTAQRKVYTRTNDRSPHLSSFKHESDQQRRRDDIIESMYRRELKRSLL